MNKNIAKYLLSLAIIALAGGGCNVNDYNDKLDGFDGGSKPKNIQTVAATLNPADYSSIASNKDNIALAASIGPNAVAALKAIGDNKFIEAKDAELYMPAFLAATYAYLDNGSAVQVSYIHKDQSSKIVEKSLQNQYTLEDADYDEAWGEKHDTPFFTKGKPAEKFIPNVLKAAYKDALDGDYAVATYSFSNTEPTTTTAVAVRAAAPQTRAATVKKIRDIDFAGKEVATAEGTVIGLHAQGVLIRDDTGMAFFFAGAETFYTLGDVIQVSGVTQVRYGMNQFDKDKGGVSTYISHPAQPFTYPAPLGTITKDNIKTYTGVGNLVRMTGTLKVAGQYLNVLIDGMPEAEYRGSISYAFPAADIQSYDGKEITITGYFTGVSGGSTTKNFNMLLTSVKLATDGVDITATGVAASQAGNYICKGIVVATYDKGFLMNDGTGHIMVDQNKTATVEEGAYVTVSGETEMSFSMARFMSTATVTVDPDKMPITRATPLDMKGTTVDSYMAAPTYRYGSFIGKLTKNGNFYEVHNIEGTEIYGSISYPLTAQKTTLDKLINKKVAVTGYLIGSNVTKGYFSVLYGTVEQIISFPTEIQYGIYTYNGTTWNAVDHKQAIAVNEADYIDMGLQNNYFDKTNAADKYLVSFLYRSVPYPMPDQEVTVLFNYKEAAPYMMGYSYTYDGSTSTWAQNMVTEQYTLSTEGRWKFDPSVVINLIPDYKLATQAMKDFYQLGSDYVWEEIDQKQLGVTAKGKGYTSKYGTNELYSGTSAYSINVDLRASAARAQYPAGYAEMTDTQVVALMTKRLCREIFPLMLQKAYPSAKPLSGVDVTYTINFGIYTGSKITDYTHQIIYKVTDTAEFTFLSLKTVEGDVVPVDE